MSGKPSAADKRRSYTSLGKGTEVNWTYPVTALGFFIASIILAVAHHAYYKSLDGHLAQSDVDDARDSEKQVWALRIGNGLSFLYKTCIVSFFSMVGAQQVWATLRRKSMTIDGIDSMFLVMNSPRSLFNRNLLAHAKVLVLLALVSWLTPLVVVVAPPSLSVQPMIKSAVFDFAVPTVNFSDASRWYSTSGPGYVSGASLEIGTLFTKVFSSAAAVPMGAPFPNSSYEQTFYGPSYKCISLNEALAADYAPTWITDTFYGNKNYTGFEDMFYQELGLPRRIDPLNMSLIYTAAAPAYLYNMILVSTGGTNALWDGGTRPAGLTNATSDASDTNATAPDAPQGSSLVCQLYNTSFRQVWRFEDGVQSVVPLAIDYHEPQNWGAQTGENIYVQKLPLPAAIASYFVTHLLFSYLLVERVWMSVSMEVGFSSDSQTTAPLLQSPLIHCADLYNSSQFLHSDLGRSQFVPNPALCRNGTLAAAIEDLSRNFTYSTLAFEPWSPYTERVPVTSMTSRVFFTYNQGVLLAAYAVSIATGIAALAVGAYALWRNGVVGGISFSAALQTTRNPQLDDIVRQSKESSTWLDDTSAGDDRRDLGKIRLRFGHIQASGHTGFGLDGTVDPL